jgi:hypothetical protein
LPDWIVITRPGRIEDMNGISEQEEANPRIGYEDLHGLAL